MHTHMWSAIIRSRHICAVYSSNRNFGYTTAIDDTQWHTILGD